MKLRLPPLLVWLATILLMLAGVLAPGLAAAHPGHGAERGQSRLGAVQPPAGTASLDVHDDVANALFRGDDSPGMHPAELAERPDEERRCDGAACCGTGHGCCAAYLPGWDAAPSPPAGRPLAIALAGAPSGLGAPRLPEPPRPFR